MWTKVTFLVIVYILSFIAALLFSIRQLRLFQLFDFDNKTYKDFVALMTGLPEIKGSGRAEVELRDAVAEATKETVVGVSICWNYKADEEEIQKYLDDTLDKKEREYEKNDSPVPKADTSGMNPVRQQLYAIESAIFGPEEAQEESDTKSPAQLDTEFKGKLNEMESSRYAFVVFETEESRDKAIEHFAETGFEYGGKAVTFEQIDCEPDTVQWKNFDNSSGLTKIKRGAIGFCFILLGLLFWTTVFLRTLRLVHHEFQLRQRAGTGLHLRYVVLHGRLPR
jgi:hypothetical protein